MITGYGIFYELFRTVVVLMSTFKNKNSLTLSSPGFFGSSQPGRGGGKVPPHLNFFVIGRIMMKLGKLVKCLKFYLTMGFWCVNWLRRHNDVIANGILV